MRTAGSTGLRIAMAAIGCCALVAQGAHAPGPQRPIGELPVVATLKVGTTADWVAVTNDAVWVGSTGPFAVHHINPKTNRIVASVELPGEPCAGLAVGFGSLWVPLCTQPASLARVDLESNRLVSVRKVPGVAGEGSVTTSDDSVWLITDQAGSELSRIDPKSATVRQTVSVPKGSFNPMHHKGLIWITRVDGAEVTAVDAKTGAVVATAATGPKPRFLAGAGGMIWTLNQGDGSLTQIDATAHRALQTIPLLTPGSGGDIRAVGDEVWTTMKRVPLTLIDAKGVKVRCQWVGPGGDSLGIGHGSIWLTDYRGGTVSRITLADARTCASS